MRAIAGTVSGGRPVLPSANPPHLPTVVAWLTGGVLAAAVLLGGGTQPGLRPDGLVQLTGIVLFAAIVWQMARSPSRPWPPMPLILAALVAALPLLQLVPLPPWLWPHLPGRETIAATYGAVGTPLPWLPVSLDPEATWRAFLSLLPALAVGLATLALDTKARGWLTLALIAFAFASVLIGLAQVQFGADGPLRLFERTSGAVGLFANRNHFAALLYTAMLFAAAWAVGVFAERRPGSAVASAVLLLVCAALLLGIAMARSRTGLALAGLAGLGSLALAWTGAGRRLRRRTVGLLASALIFGLLLAVTFALVPLLERLEGDLAADYRWDITRITASAAQAFFPVGSGFGTFPAIYRMFEPAALLRPFHANHAHNDGLELVLEGGLPAALVLLLFIGWLGVRTAQLWRHAAGAGALEMALARAASIAAWLLVVHSLIDYPLRTTALMTFFAFTCGLIAAPARARG